MARLGWGKGYKSTQPATKGNDISAKVSLSARARTYNQVHWPYTNQEDMGHVVNMELKANQCCGYPEANNDGGGPARFEMVVRRSTQGKVGAVTGSQLSINHLRLAMCPYTDGRLPDKVALCFKTLRRRFCLHPNCMNDSGKRPG